MAEAQQGRYVIRDMIPPVVKALLHFIYTGEVLGSDGESVCCTSGQSAAIATSCACRRRQTKLFIMYCTFSCKQPNRNNICGGQMVFCKTGMVTASCLRPDIADAVPEEYEGNNMDVPMAQHLLAAADMYQLIRLRQVCERRLCESVDVETVATTLALAEQNHAEVKRRTVFMLMGLASRLPTVAAPGFTCMCQTRRLPWPEFYCDDVRWSSALSIAR